MSTIDLRTAAVHLGGDGRGNVIPEFDHDYDRYVAEHCREGAPGHLVVMYETRTDWPSWEAHPAGEELVVMLTGRARFFQDFDGDVREVVVGPGDTVVNPAGVPHTADVIEPFLALYVTPGPGTTHTQRRP